MSTWNGVAEAYRRSFATLCAGTDDTLVEATGPAHVHLDVGCGTGSLALAAARQGRRVIAVDPDPDMVAMTRRAVSPSGLDVDVFGAGAPSLPLDDSSVDAVTANFVVNHVPDPRASVRDLARVAAPSARVAMTIWPASPGPHLAAYASAAEGADAVPVPSSRLAPERNFERSPAGLAELAENAGLRIEHAGEVHWTWRVTADDLFAGIAGGIAGPGRIHQVQTEAVREKIEERVRGLWAQYSADDGVLAFPVTAVLVVAVRP